MVSDMTFLKQAAGSNECWFACTLMVLLHFKMIVEKPYGDLKEDFRQMKVTDPVLGEGETTVGHLYVTGGSETTIMELLNQGGLNTRLLFRENSAQQFDQTVERALNAGAPVILGLNRGAGGHFVVAVGIDGGNYVVFDSLASQPGTTISVNDAHIASAVIIS